MPILRRRTSVTDPTPPLGAADCERVRSGPVAQPANTLSTWPLVAAGPVIARRHRGDPYAALVGACVTAAGVGSIAYHSAGGGGAAWQRVADWAHDATIAAMAGAVCLADVRAVRPDLARPATTVWAVAAAAAGAVLAVRPDAERPVAALAAGAALAAEWSLRRRDARDPADASDTADTSDTADARDTAGTNDTAHTGHSPDTDDASGTRHTGDTRHTGEAARALATQRTRRRARRTADGLLVAALVAYAAGRTGAPTCRPDSWLQPHGLWHALTGAAMVAWADAAMAGR